ncbi:MAG: hypothetical protein WAN65_22635, partial [Candidatus Sulfotelmatobacter sp.]
MTKHVREENAEECQYGAGHAGRVFQENGEHRRVFTADNFVPGTFFRVFSRQKFLVGDTPGIEVEG